MAAFFGTGSEQASYHLSACVEDIATIESLKEALRSDIVKKITEVDYFKNESPLYLKLIYWGIN